MPLPLYHLRPLSLFSSFHQTHVIIKLHPKSLPFSSKIEQNRRKISYIPPPKSASVNGYSVHDNDTQEGYSKEFQESNLEFGERLRRWINFVRSIFPGGSWWNFSDEVQIQMMAKPVTVWRALRRMWELINQDRLLVFAAFAALIVTAVKRMRETLYSTLLLQDISFFDAETVGDLTSRLGADCQQVSRVIGNDLNLILRNLLQATGALIYLLILSWPLGLCTLAICSALFTIMLFYGQYQKKAAKLTQEFTASANEVAQETVSLMRTVRVYGTEQHELGRLLLC